METSRFYQLTEAVYDRIWHGFDEIDPDLAEADRATDNLRITFANKTVFVINRQGATSQIWLATKRSGYHFNFDESKAQWVCDKTGAEFFGLLGQEIAKELKQPFSF